MHINRPAVLRLALLFLLGSLAACQQEARDAASAEAPETAAAADAASTAEPAPPAPSPTATDLTPTPAASPVGEFASDDTRLSIGERGTFVLERGGDRVEGTWTLEQDGRRVRLDPNSKAEPDRVFDIVSPDELRHADGNAPSLLRQPAG